MRKRKCCQIQLKNSDLNLTIYNGIQLNSRGKITVKVDWLTQQKLADIYIMKGKGPTLLGRQWLNIFGVWPINLVPTINNIFSLKSTDIRELMISKSPALFSKSQGCYNGRKVSLVFKDNVKPNQMKSYHVPFALIPKVKAELHRLTSRQPASPL